MGCLFHIFGKNILSQQFGRVRNQALIFMIWESFHEGGFQTTVSNCSRESDNRNTHFEDGPQHQM